MSDYEFGVSTVVQALDTERIVQTLAVHEVEYVLIGGLAAIAHGSTLATADADVLPRRDKHNLVRVLAALRELDAHLLVSERRLAMESGDVWEQTELRKGPSALAASQTWHFTTSAGPIDVIMYATGVGTFDDHVRTANRREVFGIEIVVAGLQDLIVSKEALSRPKDIVMLTELRDLEGRTGS